MLSKEKTLKIKETAEKYRNVPAPHGEDIDLNEYKINKSDIIIDSLEDLDREYRSQL